MKVDFIFLMTCIVMSCLNILWSLITHPLSCYKGKGATTKGRLDAPTRLLLTSHSRQTRRTGSSSVHLRNSGRRWSRVGVLNPVTKNERLQLRIQSSFGTCRSILPGFFKVSWRCVDISLHGEVMLVICRKI